MPGCAKRPDSKRGNRDLASATDSKLSGATVRRHRPISAYPLFPAFVALWFGALLGLSSLAVGVVNLERAAAAAQLHLLLPAAAPPLGATARTLIALALTLAGGAFGFVLGLVIARRHKPAVKAPPVSVRARDTHPDAPVRRPISAHEEFGDPAEHDTEAVFDMQALRASSLVVDREDADDDFALPSFLTDGLPPSPSPVTSEAVTSEAVTSAAATSEPEAAEPQAEAFGLRLGEGVERIASAELEELSPIELLERMAMAMQRRLDHRSRLAASAAGEGSAEEAPLPGRITPLPVREARDESDETERALRDALSALQRMTGTA